MKKLRKKDFACVILILLFPAALLLNALSAGNPGATEAVYSRKIYPVLSAVLSAVPGVIPFCVAELLLIGLILGALCLLAVLIIRFKRITVLKTVRAGLLIVSVFCAGCFLFTVLWGLNYNREPLAENLHYKAGQAGREELAAVLSREVDAVNSLCPSVRYDAARHSYYPKGRAAMGRQVNDGYAKLARLGPLFNANPPHPKGLLLSGLMSYTATDGIFIPFTYEPCVNTLCPDFMLPFNMAHESAHFKGFAREEEANFVAYLADAANSDAYFRYSAHLAAYIYVSNALYETDNALWNGIASRLDARAQSDLACYNSYISRYSGPVQDVSQKINDTYLKSQGQQGVISYDRFVSLLCAQYRTEQAK